MHKKTTLYINRGFRPKLPVSGHTLETMIEVGVCMPPERNKHTFAEPAHTYHKGLSAAVWLPNPAVSKVELPIIAVAKAEDDENIDLRKVEGFYIGIIPTEEYLELSGNCVADELLERAQHRLSETEIDLYYGLDNKLKIRNDRKRRVTETFPEDKFLEFMGIVSATRH